jgi:hypothetical protein
MAHVIAFPGVALPAAPQPPQRAKKAKPATPTPVVVRIRRGVSIAKGNRPEDLTAIATARVADSFEAEAYALAQTEPGSAKHLQALHLADIRRKLPCNNLRIFTTPEDVVQGLWRAQRRVELAAAEFALADLQRMAGHYDGDDEASERWGAITEKAEARLWLEYERLIRIPATSVTEHRQFKYGKWHRGVGNIEWMRKYKPAFAAILDDELARLEAEKAARGTKRKGAR